MTLSALTIAASDPAGGAGIEADLKVFAAHRVFGLTAITALTIQDSTGVRGVVPLPVAAFREVLALLAADQPIAAIKIGALATALHLDAVADFLLRLAPRPPVVLDPVLAASSGHELLPAEAVSRLRERLLPLVTIVTPNLPEAGVLTGRRPASEEEMIAAGREFIRLGAAAALIKGGHLEAEPVDVLVYAGGVRRWSGERMPHEYHGTGCALASAIAARLARGEELAPAVEGARRYLRACMEAGRPGKGRAYLLDFPPAD